MAMAHLNSAISKTSFFMMLMGASLTPQSLRAQETNPDTIIACMIEKTTEENKAVMRNMIIAALQDNQSETKKYVVQLGSFITDLALNKCSMSYQMLTQPQFKDIARRYGQQVGEEMMRQAFAKLK
jgi:hypothetical protein